MLWLFEGGSFIVADPMTPDPMTPDPTTSAGLDLQRIPTHVACVMDGNGRWAQARGLARFQGHRAGEKALVDVVEGALDIGLQWLTIYVLSTENWRRPSVELEFLIENFEQALLRQHIKLHERGVRIRFIGRRDERISESTSRLMDEVVSLTEENRVMTLTAAFNYGGRAEIVDAVREIVDSGVSSELVTEQMIASHLYSPDMPDLDLMIRTAGEYRTSNFLLWQSAYGELYFVDISWPDFRREHFFEAIRVYQNRVRRFGGVPESLQ